MSMTPRKGAQPAANPRPLPQWTPPTSEHTVSQSAQVFNAPFGQGLYRTAMRYNRRLDRDKDGIACEKL
jgi:hypothetical protein